MIHFIFIVEDILQDRWTFSPWLGGNWGIWVWWWTFPDFAMEVNERAKIRILKFRPTLFAPIKLLHSRQPPFTVSCLVSGGLSLSILVFFFVWLSKDRNIYESPPSKSSARHQPFGDFAYGTGDIWLWWISLIETLASTKGPVRARELSSGHRITCHHH